MKNTSRYQNFNEYFKWKLRRVNILRDKKKFETSISFSWTKKIAQNHFIFIANYVFSPFLESLRKSSIFRILIFFLFTDEHSLAKDLFKNLTICFSVYLLEESRLTASMWPKSMSWPSRKMKSNLQTYFFFWYPSNVLSPLNFDLEYKFWKWDLISLELFLSHHGEHSFQLITLLVLSNASVAKKLKKLIL